MSIPVENPGFRKMFVNIGGTFIRQVGVMALNLTQGIFFARILKPEGNGLFALAFLLPALLSIFLNTGITPANVYYISRGSVSPEEAFAVNIRLWGWLSMIGIIVAVPLIQFWGNKLFPGVSSTLLWLTVPLFPFMLLQTFLASLLHGLQDFRRFNIISLVQPGAALFFAFFTLWIFKMAVVGAIIATAMSHMLALILTFYALKVHFRKDELCKPTKEYAKKCINYGWKAYLSNIITFVNYRADLFLVNIFINPVAAGAYVIAVRIVERLWVLSNAVSTVIFPLLSELSKNEEGRRNLTPLVCRWVLISTIFLACILALIAKPFITILFGKEFIKAAQALLFLLPGVTLFSFTRVISNDIAARGRPDLNMYVSFIVVAINICANCLLIPSMGINGAALATTIAYSTDGIIKLYLYARLSGNIWWRPLIFEHSDWVLLRQGAQALKRHV
jgi:O-antigen/teichoic acid export membrane protein